MKDRITALVLCKALANNGIFAVYSNNDKKVIQFLPPLIITDQQAKEIMARFLKALQDLEKLKFKILAKAAAKIFSN